MWHVYLLLCDQKTFYVGISDDPGDRLSKLSPDFRKVYDVVNGIRRARERDDEENKKLYEQQLEPFKCISRVDNVCLGDYVLDLPEIGFRVYFLPWGNYIPLVLVNTSKPPPDVKV